MFDFKTFAQMNLDLIFKGFDRMPLPGEEVFAERFSMQLGGGPMVCPIVLNRLGCNVRLGTFMVEDAVSDICRTLLQKQNFSALDIFQTSNPDPVVVTSVFSWAHDRGLLSHNEQVYESSLDEETVFGFLQDAKVVFAPVGHPAATKRLHEKGVKVVYDNGWSDDLSIDRVKDILPFVDIYTPNDKEAMKIAGTDQLEDAIRFLARYTPSPVVTLGKGGCAYCQDGQIRYVPAIDAFAAIDTTGAGDNFMAGVVYGLLHDEALETCLRLGNIFAGHSTTAVGCFGAEITPELIQKYL